MVTRPALDSIFPSPTWSAWRCAAAALYGLPPESDDEVDLFRRCTGRSAWPTSPSTRAAFIVGRRGGKSTFVSRITALEVTRSYADVIAPGERGIAMIVSPDRRQGKVVKSYVSAVLRSMDDGRPRATKLVVAESAESLTLRHNISVEVHTRSFRAVRGWTCVLAVLEETAFWPTDDSANPDTEVISALEPAMATVPGALLLAISSPYAKAGWLWETYHEHYGRDDSDTLVWAADSKTMNPLLSSRVVERAFRDDPVAAASEYGRHGTISFRSDVSGYISEAALAAVTPIDVRELAPDGSRDAFGHFDAATGAESAQDAAAAAVAFAGVPAELAAVRRWTPPFDPASVIAEAARLFLSYGVARISIDRYAPNLVATLFRQYGIDCEVCDKDTSGNFGELLPAIHARRVRLLDNVDLQRELSRLERRPSMGGKDRIGHGARGGHDDVAAAVAGALCAALKDVDQEPLRLLFGAEWQADQQRGAQPVAQDDDHQVETQQTEIDPVEAQPDLPRSEQRRQHSEPTAVERACRSGLAWFPQDWGGGR